MRVTCKDVIVTATYFENSYSLIATVYWISNRLQIVLIQDPEEAFLIMRLPIVNPYLVFVVNSCKQANFFLLILILALK